MVKIFSQIMAVHERLHRPKCDNLLISAIVLARSFCHVLVNRIVFKH